MSYLALCVACQIGDHDHHDGSHHGHPGLIGGHQCPCPGGCGSQPNPIAAILDAAGQDETAAGFSVGGKHVSREDYLALTGALEYGNDSFQSPAAHPRDLIDPLCEAMQAARDHEECVEWCDDCDQWERPRSCEHCGGSGCGPGTASGAYEECAWCAGDGRDHKAYTPTGTYRFLPANDIAAPSVPPGEPERCTGASDCTVTPHEHGCYADQGDCDDPEDHAPEGQPEGSERCATPGCPGDWRYAAPGRGHQSGCEYPINLAAPAPVPDDKAATCVCLPCKNPQWGAPGIAHCAACCGGTGIEEFDHSRPVAEHRELAERQFPNASRAPDDEAVEVICEQLIQLADDSDSQRYGTISTAVARGYADRIRKAHAQAVREAVRDVLAEAEEAIDAIKDDERPLNDSWPQALNAARRAVSQLRRTREAVQ